MHTEENVRKFTLDEILESVNLAEDLDDTELGVIGQEVVRGYEDDRRSREDWETRTEESMKLALQVVESKSTPFENAANIKYPLLTTSAIQFSARALPTLIPGPKVVNAMVVGDDPTGEKMGKGERIAQHMSYQIMEKMDNWEGDMDRLLLTLPIMGTAFKKIYYDPKLKGPRTDVVLPWDLVFDYWSKGVKDAQRVTHRLYYTKNDIVTRMRRGIYRDIDLDLYSAETGDIEEPPLRDETTGLDRPNRADEPREILEQLVWFDFDDDDYAEPYIITVDLESKQVLRIVANFDVEDIEWSEDQEVISIDPIQYYVQYIFIPDPNGGSMGLGFGSLLGPINDTVNTLINQLLDAGTISNHKSGFIGSALRLREGDTRFELGEWKVVRSSGMDIRQQIVELPGPEPNQVLFLLLQELSQAGERLSSITDTMAGENPPANQPASTTLALIEQGLKVFTAVYKRVYRALREEFKLIYRLNQQFLDDRDYFRILDSKEFMMGEISRHDYIGDEADIRPTADPTVSTSTEKMARIQAMMEGLPLGLNPEEVKRRYVEALDVPNEDALLQPPPPPPPDPEVQIKQAELQLKQAEMEMKKVEQQMELTKMQADMDSERTRLELEAHDKQLEASQKMEEMKQDGRKTEVELEKLRMEIKKIEAEINKIQKEAAQPTYKAGE